MKTPDIHSFRRVIPMIYAYNTPEVSYNEGWTKIGYTEKQSVEQRIAQQTHTAGIKPALAWRDNAMYKDGSGEYFSDHEFHQYLESQEVERRPKTEWFHIDGPASRTQFDRFASRDFDIPEAGECYSYMLRSEQDEAVRMTQDYFTGGGTEFLWNAKPRFGKTLASYDLVRRMHCFNVLIVTNRPAISNSWAEDFRRFISWQEKLCFVSDTDSLSGKPGVLSREEYVSSQMRSADPYGMVAFVSLQDLKGSIYFGGHYDKLKWIVDLPFDLLIVDESQEGVDTWRTERAFDNISRKHTLYLSGTPFKALANEQFGRDQIFNWSYADEQDAKERWDGEDSNPYEALPRMEMYTYQMSDMIMDRLQRGADLTDDDGASEYAFDLNEFFATNEAGRFVHEDDVRRFLTALSTQEKYPFSTPELRDELKHTMWLLNRVASAKALERMLREDPVFSEYHVVLAAGDGRTDDQEKIEKSFDRVIEAIAKHEKTITLTVGQLTVGVTIPEWSGVLMLCNLKSPSSYMQAAFRAQNPCIYTDEAGRRMRKETSYVFDFDPARTLIIFDEFANNLRPDTAAGRGTTDDRKENIRRLLNFFPVLGEDDEGEMVELDAAAVLSIPRRIKSQEVVRRGFMSNFLFRNIANVFGAPQIVKEIVEKLTPAHEDPKKRDKKDLEKITEVTVDENGEAEVPAEIVIGKTQDIFGKKRFESVKAEAMEQLDRIADSGAEDLAALDRMVDQLIDTVSDHVAEEMIAPAAEAEQIRKSARKRIEKEIMTEIAKDLNKTREDFKQTARIAHAEHERRVAEAETEREVREADNDLRAAMTDAMTAFSRAVEETTEKVVSDRPQQVVEKIEKAKAEETARSVEDSVRAHLRGFSRTIPSFIMAYDDGGLTLANFDRRTEADVFREVTGITVEDFRFLRDGGDYQNEATGETEHFPGQLFDEVVFNDSIEEFRRKRAELADYFDESHEEDIFDYIPPQKTNQIFTPKRVVKMMVDELEKENPGCFDDPTRTFADLYMKSGLYITEIVKRLYRSPRMKELIPDDAGRVRHILTKQVYGMAPTRIIYLIATNYILGFDPELEALTANFVQADAAEAAKAGRLAKLVDKSFFPKYK
ncbi:MAG: DEAD/DEAH box helicase family protein [Lachnospiraceae bacterium]|nr:DEAD/DEAH box helicase family protein [Lachnospiraceae bacterium]